MSRCLVDVDFLYNEKDYVFAKRILVCGITPQSQGFVKDILYQYPKTKRGQDKGFLEEEEEEEETLARSFKNVKYGNLEFPRTDLELSKTLKKFNIIIVKNHLEKEFICNYTSNPVIVVETEKKKKE